MSMIVYKIPYRRARAWPSGCIGRVRRASKGILHTMSMTAHEHERRAVPLNHSPKILFLQKGGLKPEHLEIASCDAFFDANSETLS